MGLSVNMLILNVNTECILLLCICEIQGCIRNYSTLLRNFLYLRTSCLRHNNNNNNIKDNFDIVIDVMDKILIFIIYKFVGSQVLQYYFTDYQKAEIQLQASLTSYFCGLGTIATSADPYHRRFAARLEHRVTSGATCKPHYSDFAVKHVLPSSSDNNEGCASNNEKLCILVELKCSGVESMHQSGFQNAFHS